MLAAVFSKRRINEIILERKDRGDLEAIAGVFLGAVTALALCNVRHGQPLNLLRLKVAKKLF